MLIASAKNKKTIRYRAIGLIGIVVSFILIMMGAVGSFGTPKSPSSMVAPSASSVYSHKIESLNQV
jgi:putative flippase GtrA